MKLSKSASASTRFPNLLWNEDDLAAAIGISVKRVQQLAREGLLPAFKLGRNWRFDPDAIRTWIKESGKSEQVSAAQMLQE
jgi:excisionase family DNA binding protein